MTLALLEGPSRAAVLGPQFVCRRLHSLGLYHRQVPSVPPLQASGSHFLGKRRSEPIWEKLSAEDAGIVSRSAELYLAGYICSPTHLSQLRPRLSPLSPLSSLSCTIEPASPLLTLFQLCNCGLGHRLFFAWCQRLFTYQECVFKRPSPEQKL